MRLISLLVLFFALGCSSTTLIRKPATGQLSEVRVRHHIALWGLWEVSPPVNPEALCGTGEWVKVHSQFDVMGIVLGVVTLGAYTPATATVTCAPALASVR